VSFFFDSLTSWLTVLRTSFSLAIILAIACQISVVAQQPQPSTALSKEQELGIAAYKKGDTKEAIKQLNAAVKKNSSDGESWYYLGLARIRDDDYKNAAKAFEKAVKLSPQLSKVHSGWAYALLLSGKIADAEREAKQSIGLNQEDGSAHYVMGAVLLHQSRNSEAALESETAIKQTPGMALAYLLKSQALVGVYSDRSVGPSRPPFPLRMRTSTPIPRPITEDERITLQNRSRQNLQLLGNAATALETYLSLSGNDKESELWRTQLATLKIYAGQNENDSEKTYTMAEVATKPKILAKPEAMYSEAARQGGVKGTVMLSVILTADGKADHILVLRGLPLGLTEQSIAVARKIKFVPGMVDGKPVSTVVHVEYNFWIYSGP